MSKHSTYLTALVLIAKFFFVLNAPLSGQPTEQELASNPKLFLQSAQKALGWDLPADPVRIGGPIYFVGTKGLSVFLITTSAGNIVLNTGMPGSGPMIEQSIRTLGFKPEDIKILLASHSHCDHVGGHAYLKKLSGAKIAMITQEKDLFESGGKQDFHYGAVNEFRFEPSEVDWVFNDNDKITLGNVTLTALLTSGHTKGSTTFLMQFTESGKTYDVVFPNGTSVNPGYRLVKNPSYEGIQQDFRRTIGVLESLKPDIWLYPHNEGYAFQSKRDRAATEGIDAWVDPKGYQEWVSIQRAKIEAAIAKESAR